MRKPIIAGNWKMNKTPAEAAALVNELKPLVADAQCDVVVETFVNVDATGLHPAIANPLPKAAQNIVIPTSLREEMFMEAAMDWDVAKLTAALSVDPLVQDFTKTRQIAKEILDYNAQFLPEGWI